jgi:mycothiol synthase
MVHFRDFDGDPSLHTSSEQSLRFRPATLDDCEQVTDLLNTCARVLTGANEFSVEGLRSEWEQPGFDLSASSWAAVTTDGRIVGYIDIWDMEDPPIKPFVFGRVHPDFEGQGIGTSLMKWAEERSRQVIDRVPADARVAMKAGTVASYQPSVQLLLDRGMTPVRYTLEMGIELPAALPPVQWPAGISQATHAERGDALAVYRAYKEAWQDHRDSIVRDEEQDFPLWLHRMTTDPDYDPSLWFLAMEGTEIAGVALCKPMADVDPDMGWVETLAVRRPWRRRGVARTLLHHAFGEFARRGFRRVALQVDAGSLTGATRLYERVGMSPKEEYVILEKELRPGIDLSTQNLSV